MEWVRKMDPLERIEIVGRVVQDEAFEPLGELADIEVDEESDRADRQFEITHQLGFVQGGDLVNQEDCKVCPSPTGRRWPKAG